ncbi:type II toxin-antitoxin system VapB family antitoxin [Methylomonas sp. HYX-M1]|uniref:type II toxin-antitoxin system VapB family antitoxin n=1 Tax=Methylomonas sp. HYX-M1 TaxID=3139307 RepID=UPI00345C3DC8
MKTTISLDNSVLEQLLIYTQAKTTKESIAEAIEEYIRFKQRQELLNCQGRSMLKTIGKHYETWKVRHETGVNRYLCLDRLFQIQKWSDG